MCDQERDGEIESRHADPDAQDTMTRAPVKADTRRNVTLRAMRRSRNLKSGSDLSIVGGLCRDGPERRARPIDWSRSSRKHWKELRDHLAREFLEDPHLAGNVSSAGVRERQLEMEAPTMSAMIAPHFGPRVGSQ